MTARGWIRGYGYAPPSIYKGPSAGRGAPGGSRGPSRCSSRRVGGVIYKTRESAGGRGDW